MAISIEAVPLLVIEDNKRHFDAMREHFPKDRYELERLEPWNDVALPNYKALNSDAQIIIVDLNLGAKSDFDLTEGLSVIRDILWPVDRTAFFIVYSQYVDKNATLPSLMNAEPHWMFVSKELTAEDIPTQNSLDTLLDAVERIASMTAPSFDTPHYESFRYVEQIESYAGLSRLSVNNFHGVVKDRIVKSVGVLNTLAHATSSFAKIGAISRNIAIGIYGSCGRLEMRDDSDIECSVYYEDEENIRNRQTVATLWNRVMLFADKKGLKFEGKKDIDANVPPLLLARQVNDELANRFVPCIRKDFLFARQIDREPHIRNRHYQILTELRPIFNPRLINEIKRELILQNSQCDPSDKLGIITSTYFSQILDQMFLDTQPASLAFPRDIKRFCYRILNILALRISIIGMCMFEELELKIEQDWLELFERLCEPGVIKVIRFTNSYYGAFKPEEKDALASSLHHIIEQYCKLLFRVGRTVDLRKDARVLANHFFDALKIMVESRDFARVHDTSWLFESAKASELMGRI